MGQKTVDEKSPATKECARCGGTRRVFVVDRVVQGQDYGPETEGHYETCPYCHDPLRK